MGSIHYLAEKGGYRPKKEGGWHREQNFKRHKMNEKSIWEEIQLLREEHLYLATAVFFFLGKVIDLFD